jgi:DNA-binding SARP family transcriptional activator/predicted ATPase
LLPIKRSMLKVITLGSLEIHLHEQRLRFKMSKAGVLLVYLMCQSDKAHGREHLATLFWPELDDHKSNENFRQALYQIRRALGDQADSYLRTSSGTVQFIAQAPHTLDTHQLEQAITHKAWETAADLYRGEFLSTFYPDTAQTLGEWQVITREHFHQLAVQALTELARQEETSDPQRAIQYGRRLLSLEPWAERGHRLLMRCWMRLGQPAEALAQYQRCAQILADELGATPTLKTTALYEQIRDGRWTAISPAPSHSRGQLAANLTPLIGREKELADLCQLLAQPECRLLTIMGVGGVGKTKLLLNLGWACHHTQQYGDGVLFASLAELEAHGAEPVAAQIAHFLAWQLLAPVEEMNTATAVDLLQAAWHGRPILLLLDNCEHLLEGATLLTALLTRLPQLTIVTTSRVPLNLHGEWLYPLHGLNLTTTQGATQLFAQAARRVQPQFSLEDKPTAEAVGILCRALEGHPLALEMAAAALRGLTLTELVAEVTAGLDILTLHQPNIPARQRDMRHLLAASWGRLGAGEQKILAQLSLFRQPFTAVAAQAVAGARVGQMATIVAQAWLRRTAEGRYQTHELLRHFAHEQLAENPTLENATKTKFARYYLHWMADWTDKPLTSSILAELSACWADITRAWAEGVQQQMWAELEKAIPSLGAFYEHKGLLGEGISWLALVERELPDTAVSPDAKRVRAQLLIAQADLRNTQVQSAPVPNLIAQAIILAQEIGDGALQLRAKIILMHGLWRLGRLEETLALGLALLNQTAPPPTPQQEADLHMTVGMAYGDTGEIALGEQYIRQAIAYYEQEGIMMARATGIRHNLALLLTQRAAYSEARRLLLQNMLFWRKYPSPPAIAFTYEGLGVVAMHLGRLGLAASYLRQAKRLYEQMGDKDGLAYVALYEGKLALARSKWRQAEGAFFRSAELREELNPRLLAQPWAGLAMVAWREGNTAVAQTYFDKLLPIIFAGEVEGEGIAWVYEVMAELAQAMNHPQTNEIQATANSKARHRN